MEAMLRGLGEVRTDFICLWRLYEGVFEEAELVVLSRVRKVRFAGGGVWNEGVEIRESLGSYYWPAGAGSRHYQHFQQLISIFESNIT